MKESFLFLHNSFTMVKQTPTIHRNVNLNLIEPHNRARPQYLIQFHINLFIDMRQKLKPPILYNFNCSSKGLLEHINSIEDNNILGLTYCCISSLHMVTILKKSVKSHS